MLTRGREDREILNISGVLGTIIWNEKVLFHPRINNGVMYDVEVELEVRFDSDGIETVGIRMYDGRKYDIWTDEAHELIRGIKTGNGAYFVGDIEVEVREGAGSICDNHGTNFY